MAGELEHIRPTDPSYGNPASRTRNINFVDANGVARSITHVYWSPTNNSNDVKLIWQRDHTPVVVKYKNILNSNVWTMFKWTATHTYIDTIKMWCMNQGDLTDIYGQIYIYERYDNGQGNIFGKFKSKISSDLTTGDVSIGTDTLNVNNADVSVSTLTLSNINSKGGLNNLTIGNEYYIFVNNVSWGNRWVPLFYETGVSTVWTQTYNLWQLGQDQRMAHNEDFFTSQDYTDKPKIEINGVQV